MAFDPNDLLVGGKEVEIAVDDIDNLQGALGGVAGEDGPQMFEDDPAADTSQLPFYNKVKPKLGAVTVKAAVTLPLPLYNFHPMAKTISMLTPQDLGATGGSWDNSANDHKGQPLTFQYIYENFDAADFAQLLVTGGAISKAIRYALLYNYFGYPIANYSNGDGDWETHNTGFAALNNLAKRCLGKDDIFIKLLHKPLGIIWSGDAEEEAHKKYLTDYMTGFYQLGDMGRLPSFNLAAWNQGIDGTGGINYFSPIKLSEYSDKVASFPGFKDKDVEEDALGFEEVPPFDTLYNDLHGKDLFYADKHLNDISYVDIIGIDAQYSGISAHNGTAIQSGAEIKDLVGSTINSLRYVRSWGVHTNSICKTHARAWLPSDTQGYLQYGEKSFDPFLFSNWKDEPVGNLHPNKFTYFSPSADSAIDNHLWLQTTFNSFGNTKNAPFQFMGEQALEFNSMAFVVGSPKDAQTSQLVANTPENWGDNPGDSYNGFWVSTEGQQNPLNNRSFNSWYHNWDASLEPPENTPFIYEDGNWLNWKNIWQAANIASMYKLVPAGIKTNSELNKYRKDPSKTLNVIWPKIWDFVERVAPKRMYQTNHPTYTAQPGIPITPGTPDGSPLNSSDVITYHQGSGPNGEFVAYDLLRKFRIGHEMTPTKAGGEGYNPFGPYSPFSGPVPSADQGGELGFTHILGDDGDRGYHLMSQQDLKGPGTGLFSGNLNDPNPKPQEVDADGDGWIDNEDEIELWEKGPQTPTGQYLNDHRRFRNKISLNFQTDFHRAYFWDSLYEGGFGSTDKYLEIDNYKPNGSKETILGPLFPRDVLDINNGGGYTLPNPMISYKFIDDYRTCVDLDHNFSSALPDTDGDSIKIPNHWEDELSYSYYLSTKLLTYLYLFRPAGFDGSLPSDIPDDILGSPTEFNAQHATCMQLSVLEASLQGNVHLPTAVATTTDGLQSLSKYSLLPFEEKIVGWTEVGGMPYGIKAQNPYYNGGTDAWNTTKQSKFALPVWFYNEGTPWDPKDISWSKLSKSEKKLDYLQEKGTIDKYPGIENLKNYGLPSWVRGIRIYPCPDKEIIPTNPAAYGPADIGDWHAEAIPPIFPTDKDSEGQVSTTKLGYAKFKYTGPHNAASAALKLVAEPINRLSLDEFALQMANNSSLSMFRHVKIRYVVELDIDERDLILTMAGQGCFQLDGTVEEYENIGISLQDIIDKTAGNVTSEDIIEELDTGNYDFDISGNAEIDFQNLPGAGILPPSEVETVCALFAEPELLEKALHIQENNPANVPANDYWKCTSYLCLKDIGHATYRLKKAAGKDADNIGYLDDGTIVKVTKEWANGKGEFHKVLIVDDSSPYFMEEGYLPPELLKPLFPNSEDSSRIFFEQKFQPEGLNLTESPKLEMSRMAKALIPNWWKLEEPYYHREDMEYWANVELPYECVSDDQDLETKKGEAIIIGIKQLFDFYNVLYTETEVNKLAETYLAVKAEDCYIDSRPGAPIKVLVKVGAIYLKAFPNKQKQLKQLKASSARIISLDSRHYQTHLQHAIFSLNKIYLDIFSSKFAVVGLDLEAEAKRLSYIPVGLKKLLAVNGYESSGDDRQDIINIGFDKFYNLTFVSVIEGAGPSSSPDSQEERLMTVGFDMYKNSEPFNFPNTMSLLFHHRELKNPVLKWETVVNKWMINPTYEIVPKSDAEGLGLPSNSCGLKYFDLPPLTEILMGIGEKIDLGLDLHPRYDLGAFQFNLLQFFPPCPKPAPGKGSPFYKMLSEIEGQTVDFSRMDFMEALEEEASRIQQYVGDWLSSGAALRDIRDKIFDLDDLYSYVLNYITPEALYSKICKCFLDLMGIEEIPIPNFEISASGGSGGLNLDPNTLANNPSNIYDGEGAKFNTNFVDKDGKLKNKDSFMEALDAEDLFCSFCFNIPSVFFRLPTTNLLDFLIAALKALLEFAIAQILLELIMALLDALLTCPEINCPSGQGGIRDFGAQSLEELAPQGIETYKECGIPIDGVSITNGMVQKMLEDISESLTSSEVLGLLDGSATKETVKACMRVVQKYPTIEGQLGTTAQLTSLFSCVGKKAGPDTLDSLAEEVTVMVNDKEVCNELIANSEQLILDKCGDVTDAISLASKVLNPDFSKYADIAKIIRENDDLSTQLPPLFSDGKGTQALLSGLKTDTADFALQETLETQAALVESTLTKECSELFKAPNSLEALAGVGNIYVKSNPKFAYYKFNGAFQTWTSAIFDAGEPAENELAGLNVVGGTNVPINVFIQALENSTIALLAPGSAILRATLTPDDYVQLVFNSPYDSDGDGNLEHNDSYSFDIKSFDGINITINGESSELAPDMLELLNNNKLVDNGSSEQSQFLSYLVYSNLGYENTDIPEGMPLDMLRKQLEGEIYINALSTGLSRMAETVSESNLLGTYDIGFWDAVSATLAGPLSLPTLALLPPIAAFSVMPGVALSAYEILLKLLPPMKRRQLEKINMVTKNATNNKRTFVDFDFGIELAKVEYDFSKYYDPNSPFIGMPHYAMLESVISNMVQVFIGEAFMRGIFVLPFFPKELFLNDMVAKYILANLDSYLNKKGGSAAPKLRTTLMRMIYNKKEFTPNVNSAKPLMPGESQDIDALVAGNQQPFGGKIYDATLGREYLINSWKDCALYFIRKNMDRPLTYIKDKLTNATLGGGVPMDQQLNPYFVLIQKNILEVHSHHDMIWLESKPNNSSSTLVQFDKLEKTKNGAFVIQYYFRIEDLGPEDDMYNQFLVARTKALLSETNVGLIDGDDWTPPVDEEEQELVDEILNPFDEDYEGYPWPGSQPHDFVGNPVEGQEFLLVAPPDYSLKDVLNRDSLFRLWQTMNINENNTTKGNYQINIDDQTKSFSSFFKSIKLGARLCYVIGSTTEVDPDTGVPLVDKGLIPQKESVKNMVSQIEDILNQDKAGQQDIYSHQLYKKMMLIKEKHVAGLDTSVILPLISKEVDITNHEIFENTIENFDPSGDNISSLISNPEIVGKLNNLVVDILAGIEGKTLFKYCLPIPKLATMLFMYNAVGVSTDLEINNAFDGTKEIIKQNFESIYDVKGPNAYKYQAPYIKERGGARGIAANSNSTGEIDD